MLRAGGTGAGLVRVGLGLERRDGRVVAGVAVVQHVGQLVRVLDEVVLVGRPMRLMGGLLARHRSPAEIMQLYASEDAGRDRYGPCTCGSGRKWKFCHGAPA